MYNGIIVADSPPSGVTGYAWIRVMPDGSREWRHLDIPTQQWVLDSTEPAGVDEAAVVSLITTHAANEDAHHALGLTGARTIAGHTFTFTKGILTGYTPP